VDLRTRSYLIILVALQTSPSSLIPTDLAILCDLSICVLTSSSWWTSPSLWIPTDLVIRRTHPCDPMVTLWTSPSLSYDFRHPCGPMDLVILVLSTSSSSPSLWPYGPHHPGGPADLTILAAQRSRTCGPTDLSISVAPWTSPSLWTCRPCHPGGPMDLAIPVLQTSSS
jgi:hypothetical protein